MQRELAVGREQAHLISGNLSSMILAVNPVLPRSADIPGRGRPHAREGCSREREGSYRPRRHPRPAAPGLVATRGAAEDRGATAEYRATAEYGSADHDADAGRRRERTRLREREAARRVHGRLPRRQRAPPTNEASTAQLQTSPWQRHTKASSGPVAVEPSGQSPSHSATIAHGGYLRRRGGQRIRSQAPGIAGRRLVRPTVRDARGQRGGALGRVREVRRPSPTRPCRAARADTGVHAHRTCGSRCLTCVHA